MPTAYPTAGRYNPADRVIVIVDFDSFLANEKAYDYMTPQWLITRAEELFGTVVIPYFVTKKYVSFRDTPFKKSLRERKRTLTTIDSWIKAGFRLLPDLQNPDTMNVMALGEIAATQAHTFIWVGDYSVFRWFDGSDGLLKELKKRDVKLVILSPNQKGFLHEYADEEMHFNDATRFQLREINALPKRLRPQEVPHPLKQLEWKDPDTHAQISELLSMEDISSEALYKGLCYQFREGTMPDLVLALLLVLAIQLPQEARLPDLDILASLLENYAVEAPRETVERALWILYEINMPGIDYAVQPNHMVAFSLQDCPDHLGAVRALAQRVMNAYPRGIMLLDTICASLEIFCCNRDSITDEEIGYLQDWLSIHGKRLLPVDVQRLQPDSLRRYAKTSGSDKERLNRYKKWGVQRLDHINDFEERVLRIIDDGQNSQDASCDLDDEPVSSAVRSAA